VRIRRLQLRNIRQHADLDLTLAPGLTVVRGPNESGKTTLQRAIELALTRRVTSGSQDLDAIRTWGLTDEERPWVRLEFEQEYDDEVRPGSVEKAFRGQKGTVRLEHDGEVVTDPALADQVLAELSGIPSEAFFRSTASVRHHELDGLARDEAALRDRLQASISGADRGTSRARRKLERAIFELNTKGDKNPGRIKVVEATLATEGAAARNGEVALAQLEREGWRLDLAPLRYLSHFITPPSSPIRFTARFFLAPVPAGQALRHFREEASEAFWIDPREGSRRFRQGEMPMAEPADCGLAYLSQFESLGELWGAHADGRHKFHGILDRI